MIEKFSLNKADWQKILEQAKNLLKGAIMDATVYRGTMMMAEKALKNFPDKEEQKDDSTHL